MKRRKKNPSLGTLLKEWSKKVRDRDGNKCAVCGRTDLVQAHHIVQKKYDKELRFDLNNGIALCPRHHSFGKWSAHMGSFFFTCWLEQNRPNQYAYLRAKILREWEKENKEKESSAQ